MYKIIALLITASIILGEPAFSQKKFTLTAFTGSGISFFGGPGSVTRSNYYRTGLPFPNTTVPDTMARPFGKKLFVNFIAGLQADLRLSNWVLSLSSQYENIGGTLESDSIISPSGKIKTTGKYRRNYDFISINPKIGRIVFQKAITLTIHTGLDYTSKLAMGNQYDYTDQNGQKNSIGYSGGEPEVNDLRVTFGASITRKKWGIDINYKHGITNYSQYGNPNVYARLLHVRLQYTFLSKKI